MNEIRKQLILLWQTACRDEPMRPSCKVENGNFVFTITGNPQNWGMLCKESAVPSHATETRNGDSVSFTWESHADTIFGKGGDIDSRLPNYEMRDGQLHMARLVQRAIEMNEPAIVEGGTGVGKSYAYAAICMAMGKKVVISTSNKALQMQLYEKDIPFLQGIFPHVEVALVQGKNNYGCHYRAYDMNGVFNGPDELAEWFATSESGNVEEIPFSVDWKDLEKVTVNDYCLGKRCPKIAECFYFKAKEERKTANVLITNHMLLCMNKAYPEAQILPEVGVIVVDEAHKLADYARNVLGMSFGVKGIEQALDKAKKYNVDNTVYKLQPFAKEIAGLAKDGQRQVRIDSGATFDSGLALADEIDAIADEMWDDLIMPDGSFEVEASQDAKALHAMAKHIRVASTATQPGFVRWYDCEDGKVNVMPYNVDTFVGSLAGMVADGDGLGQNEDRVPIVFTSATLAAPTMDHFMRESGLPHGLQMIASSPFDYGNNALLYVPKGDRPAPNRDGFLEAVISDMRHLVRASQGGAFLLFTSIQMMNDVSARLRREFELNGYRVYVQGELPKLEIAKRFREDGNAVLFGTKSFFEGVSIDGDALRLVVIDKVPFEAPSPLGEAQEDAATQYALSVGMSADKAKWYPFENLRVPQAIIELKQGVGRLIRTMTDKGVVAILDPRIRTANYGRKMILPALPPALLTDSLNDVEKFYEYRRDLPMIPMIPTRKVAAPKPRIKNIENALFVTTTVTRDEDGELWA